MIGIEFVTDKKSLSPDPQWTGRVVTQALKRGPDWSCRADLAGMY